MATKFDTKHGYNSVRIKNIVVPLAPIVGLWGICGWAYWAIERCQTNSTTTNPVAMGTKFKTKSPITRLVYKIYLQDACLYNITGGFSGTGYFDVNQI